MVVCTRPFPVIKKCSTHKACEIWKGLKGDGTFSRGRLTSCIAQFSFSSLRQLASPSSTLLSLTGYLELQQKSCESNA